MKFCVEIDRAAVGGIGVHPGQDVYRHIRQWVTGRASSSGDAA
jgi:hypothetical protein